MPSDGSRPTEAEEIGLADAAESRVETDRRSVLATGVAGLLGSVADLETSRSASRDRAVTARQQASPGMENVVDHGAVLDGETDDTQALRDAFAAAGPSGGVLIPPGGKLRLTEPVVFDLEGAFGFQLFCRSPIAPDSGIGDALTIKNGQPKFVDFYVQGGGSDADYTQADPEGGEQALVLSGVRGGEYKVLGAGYLGRVLRVTQPPVDHKTSKLKVTTFETRWYGGNFCGQAFYVDIKSAVGKFDQVHAFWDHYGSVVDGGFDFAMQHLGGGWQNTGLQLLGTGSVHIDTIAMGDQSHSADLLEIRDSSDIHVKRAFLLAGKTGALIEESGNISFANLWTNSNNTGLRARDTRNVQIEHSSRGERVAADYRDCYMGSILLHVEFDKDQTETGLAVSKSSSMTFRGSIGHDIDVDGESREIRLDKIDAKALHVPEGNDVRVYGGSIAYFDGTPKKVNNVGQESADGEKPDTSAWQIGDIVSFTDTGDGSGDGVYLLLPDESWVRIDGPDNVFPIIFP